LIKTSSAKAKGRKLQQWVVDKLYDLFPLLEDGDIKSTSMGANGEDVQMSPAARKMIPLSIECKARGSVAVYGWLDQAQTNCPKGSQPILVVKQDRAKPLVVVDAEYFFNLIGE
jgi:hypothetical protein